MDIENRIDALLGKMTLREKIGQMVQISGTEDVNLEPVRQGLVGSIFNATDADKVLEFQRIAVQETRLGIPLINGRDVIHGFRTIFPTPLAQAASWDTELVEKAARIAAREASAVGVRWAFSPMVDIARDARWGRIVESAGEDPFLSGAMGAAMVRGYQGDDLSRPDTVAACPKHFAGYGATEGGRDYNTAEISERTLRDVYLKPFKACVDAGAATLMAGFNEIEGIPSSGNAFTLRQVLRGEWKFDGFVVSDWQSIQEMIVHGTCADKRDAAREGVLAGVDMEMAGTCYLDHLEALVAAGEVPEEHIDAAVRAILRVKFRLGLFDHPPLELPRRHDVPQPEDVETARQLARESCVLLRNAESLLPLRKNLASIAVIGPLADSPADQVGCWVMDRVPSDVRTPLSAIREAVGASTQIHHVRGLPDPKSADTAEFAAAVRAAGQSDITILFLGEPESLSGEARCRAFLGLPGAQEELAKALLATGKPLVVVLLTGRPLTIPWLAENAPALLLAWHPGNMGGPAIADLLFGDAAPSGKLPVTIPRTVGQIPLYYNHKNTGRPALEHVRAMPMGTPLDPVGFCSSYLDAEPTPQYPFGFGLTYAPLEYTAPEVKEQGGVFRVSACVTNRGGRAVWEVAQLYVRDVVGSVTRPVKELKGFQRIALAPGETREVSFTLTRDDLAFCRRDRTFGAEPGEFQTWIAGNSESGSPISFYLTASTQE